MQTSNVFFNGSSSTAKKIQEKQDWNNKNPNLQINTAAYKNLRANPSSFVCTNLDPSAILTHGSLPVRSNPYRRCSDQPNVFFQIYIRWECFIFTTNSPEDSKFRTVFFIQSMDEEGDEMKLCRMSRLSQIYTLNHQEREEEKHINFVCIWVRNWTNQSIQKSTAKQFHLIKQSVETRTYFYLSIHHFLKILRGDVVEPIW